jgi:isocitrate lyase
VDGDATANLDEAREFAEAIHAEFPDQMLAYNLSPSFNWDSTGMSDDAMRASPRSSASSGFVFNFITYGGPPGRRHGGRGVRHRARSRTACWRSPAAAQAAHGRVALPHAADAGRRPAQRRRAARLVGRTATTKAMGKGSTQHQHLVQTEVPKKLLEEWLALWTAHYEIPRSCACSCGRTAPARSCSSWRSTARRRGALANVVFAPIHDRRGRSILSVRDQNTFAEQLRKKRLMTLDPPLARAPLQGRLGALRHAHRGQPVPDREDEEPRHLPRGQPGVGQIIVADVDHPRVATLLERGPRGARQADRKGG